MPTDAELVELEARASRAARAVPEPPAERPSTPGRGIHHAALICSDVEQTIQFYQGLLGFPLVELVENRDYQGSVALLLRPRQPDPARLLRLPRPGARAGRRVDRRVQHIAISAPRDRWEELRARLDAAGVEYAGPDQGIEESMYFKDPDGIQIELLSDPLMYFGGRQLDE